MRGSSICNFLYSIFYVRGGKMDNELLSIKEYGNITVCLKEIMDARHITRNGLARSINVRFEVIDKWYRGRVERMDLDVLARMCYVLDCAPGDIIKYIRPEKD